MKKTMNQSIIASIGRAQIEAVKDTYGPDFNAAAYANLAYEIKLLKNGPQRPIVGRIIALKKQMMKALKDGSPTVEMEAEVRGLERVFHQVVSKKWRTELWQSLSEKFEEQAIERALAGDMAGAMLAERLHIFYENDGEWDFPDVEVEESDVAYIVALHALQYADDPVSVLNRFKAVSGMSDEDIQAAVEEAQDSLAD